MAKFSNYLSNDIHSTSKTGNNKISNDDLKEIQKLIDIICKLKKAQIQNSTSQLKVLEKYIPQLILLLSYLIHNNNLQIDNSIFNLLKKLFNRDTDQKIEESEEVEEELTIEEMERRHRLMIYEVYKVINPRQLAGETKIDNFINNVLTRGLGVALQNEGGEFAKYFSKKDLNNLASHKTSFANFLEENGMKSNLSR